MSCRIDWGKKKWKGILPSLACLVIWSCAQEEVVDRKGVLAKVGEVEIGEVELREYAAKLTSSLQSSKKGAAAVRDLLQSLVDRGLMLLDAESKGYDQSPKLQVRLHKLKVKELVQEVLQLDVGSRVQVSEEDVRALYERETWNRRIRPAHILSATEEDAWEVVALLKEGHDFAELARQRSLSDKDAGRGGDLLKYFGPADAATALADGAHYLPVGAFSDPIHTLDGWEVVKVLDEEEVPFYSIQAQLGRQLHMQRFVQLRNELLVDLEKKFAVVYHREAVDALLAAGRDERPLSAEEEQLQLVSYAGGGRIVAGPASRALSYSGKPLSALEDSVGVARALLTRILVDSLLVLEAQSRGLDQVESFLAYQKLNYEKGLVREARKRDVLDDISVSSEEVEEEYAENQDQYQLSGQTQVEEILVATAEQAKGLMAQIEAGVDMGRLAQQYSLRPEAQRTGGHVHFSEADGELDDLQLRMRDAEIGEVVGPVQVEGGFAVFRVELRRKAGVRSLEEVAYIVRHKIKKRKERRAFEKYMDALREKYHDRVQWYDEQIEELGSRWDH